MVAVYKNHGFKWFAVMVFTLSRLKTDACGETRFAAGRFTVPEKVCGFITVRFDKYRLSLRVVFGPVCTQQHLYSRTATPPMHTPSPQQPTIVSIAHPGRIIGLIFLAAPQ